MSDRHGRPYRLPGFDYGQTGCYFVTFCTQNRQNTLSSVGLELSIGRGLDVGRGLAPGSAPLLTLSSIGRTLDAQILALPLRFPSVTIEKYVIMPNHVHLLLSMHGLPGASPQPTEKHGLPGASPRPTEKHGLPGASSQPTEKHGLPGASPRPTESPRPTVSQIIGACKSLTTRQANLAENRPGRIIFQSSYHDHIIRDENDYLTHWQYIDANPAKWPEDEYYTE